MNHMIRKISSVLGWVFCLPLLVLADTTTTNPNDHGLANAPGVNLSIQNVLGIVTGLACWATRFVMIIMVVMIVWYGFQMMAAGDNEANFKGARQSLTYAIVGMIVILGAYTIIATVGNTIQAVGAQNLSTRSANFLNYTPLGSCSSNG
jgi:fumarate reductase subunit D